MSLSDCPKCWETPCICGYMYKNYSKKKKVELAASILNIETEKLNKLLKNMKEDKNGIDYRW